MIAVKQIDPSQIAQTAKDTADYIGSLVADKRVDPDHLVVMVGEQHEHVGHQYFQKKLIEFLSETTALSCVFDERDICDETEAQNLAALTDEQIPYRFASSFVQASDMPLRNMDAPHIAVPHFQKTVPYVDNVISDEYKTRYLHNAVATGTMAEYPSLIFNNIVPHHYGSRGGMLKRNLFMMDQVVTHTADKKGMALLLNGAAHLINSGDPAMPSLAELLHANGKDIVMLSLHDDDKMQHDHHHKAEDAQQQRLWQNKYDHYFENINLVIARDEDMTIQGLNNVIEKNGDKPIKINFALVS